MSIGFLAMDTSLISVEFPLLRDQERSHTLDYDRGSMCVVLVARPSLKRMALNDKIELAASRVRLSPTAGKLAASLL